MYFERMYLYFKDEASAIFDPFRGDMVPTFPPPSLWRSFDIVDSPGLQFDRQNVERKI